MSGPGLSPWPPGTPSAAEWRAGVEAALLAAGHRSTAPRRAILERISRTVAPFTAEDLVDVLERATSGSSRPTIYRLLDWLRAHGWLARVHSDRQHHAYARLVPGHHHTAVCTACGITLLIGGCPVDGPLAATLRALNFEVQGHVLELYGVCGRCRPATPQGPGG